MSVLVLQLVSAMRLDWSLTGQLKDMFHLFYPLPHPEAMLVNPVQR